MTTTMTTTMTSAKARERLAELGIITATMPSDLFRDDEEGVKFFTTTADISSARRRLAAMNALTTDTIPGGGGLSTTPTAGEIIQTNLGVVSAIMMYCNVVAGETLDENFPYLDDGQTEGRLMGIGQATVPGDPAAFGSRQSIANKADSELLIVPHELDRDAGKRMELLLPSMTARRCGRRMNRCFTFGTGASEPLGLARGCLVGTTTASNLAIAVNEVVDLTASVSSEYTSTGEARLMMHPLMLGYLMKLVDGQGRNLWMASGLNSIPRVLNEHMPSSIVAGQPTILYGQLSRAYTVRMLESRFITMTENYREQDGTAYRLIQHFDGMIQDQAACKSLVIHS